MLTIEYTMFRSLADQLKGNCTVFEAAREFAQTPEETAEIDKALEESRNFIAKTKEMLKNAEVVASDV